jgi:outer membrane protein assembly factor BamB
MVRRHTAFPCASQERLARFAMIILVAGMACTGLPRNVMAQKKPHAVESGHWNHWRGGITQTGAAASRLPEKLQVAWEFNTEDAFSGSAVIHDNVVYTTCEDGVLYAIDLATGKSRWTYDQPELMQSTPSVCGDTVYAGDDLGVMHAVELETGKPRWTFSTQGQIISAVSCSEKILVFGSYDGFVYALRPDGTLLWKFETAGRVHGTPAIADGRVIAAGCDEYLHVIDLKTGKSISQISLGSVSGASACVVGSQVFVGTYGNQVLGVDILAGKVRWRFEDPDRQFPFASSVAIAGDILVIGGRDKRIRGLDRNTGKVRWTFKSKGRVDSSAVIVGDRVFIGSGDGVIHELGLQDGKERWRFETGSAISASPAVVDGHLVLGTLDGILYSFGGIQDQSPRKPIEPPSTETGSGDPTGGTQ